MLFGKPTSAFVFASTLLALHAAPRDAGAVCPSREGSASAAVKAVIAQYRSQTVGLCITALTETVGTPTLQCAGETAIGSGVQPDSSTLFGIGSVTKTMVATLLALRASEPSSGIALNTAVGPLIQRPLNKPGLTLLR